MSSSQHPNHQEMVSAIRRRLRHALQRIGELNRLPTVNELSEELDALQFRGAHWGRRLMRFERDGLMRFGARGVHEPDWLLSEVVAEFEDEALRRGVFLENTSEVDFSRSLWIDGEQVTEALRCVLEACIAHAPNGARLTAYLVDDQHCCRFDIRTHGVGLSGLEELDHALIHGLVESAGGSIRIEEISFEEFLFSIRFERGSALEAERDDEGAWAA